ncbi:MAG: S-layer homology domain-containing protein [Oscillospiraceae bacterium]|nr:S-layer homology domain-containing protein [Oscillospiraceae bacterium]
MICSLSLSITAQAVGIGTFADVGQSDWFASSVSWAVNNGITNGTSAATFSPYDTCTRAQILTFLWRAAGEPAPQGYCPFYDVSADVYYYSAATWAYENELVGGEFFTGDAPCTRADVVTYLWKLAGSSYESLASFYDVPAMAPYSAAVSWAVRCGITNGTGDGQFSPDGICTRGQIVTFLYRAYVVTGAMQEQAADSEAEDVSAYEDISQETAVQILWSLEDTYPEGTYWGINSSYHSEALQLTWAGCAGFALYCSDLVFGDLPISEVHSDFDRIKVGDMVRDQSGSHTVVVLEKYEDSILVVEGNYNDTVHWNRVMYRTDPEFYSFTVTTRYP